MPIIVRVAAKCGRGVVVSHAVTALGRTKIHKDIADGSGFVAGENLVNHPDSRAELGEGVGASVGKAMLGGRIIASIVEGHHRATVATEVQDLSRQCVRHEIFFQCGKLECARAVIRVIGPSVAAGRATLFR